MYAAVAAEAEDQGRSGVTCGYCGKRRHYEDECDINRRESEKLKKAEEERRKNAGKGGGRQYPWGNSRWRQPWRRAKELRTPHRWKTRPHPQG